MLWCPRSDVGQDGPDCSSRSEGYSDVLFTQDSSYCFTYPPSFLGIREVVLLHLSPFVLDYDVDFFKRKVKESLLIRQKNNFNQDSGLAVSPIWLSLL